MENVINITDTDSITKLTDLISQELEDKRNFILKAELSNIYSNEELYEEIYATVERNEGLTDVKSLLQNEERKRNQKRKRWVTSVIENFENYITSGESAISGLKVNLELVNLYQSIMENKLSLIRDNETTVDEFDSYLTEKIETAKNQLNEWVSKKDSKLCEFKFFKDKSKREQKVSVLTDLNIFIYNYLENGSYLINIGQNESSHPDYRTSTRVAMNPYVEKANYLIANGIIRPTKSKEKLGDGPIDVFFDGYDDSGEKTKVYLSKVDEYEDVERGLFFSESHVKEKGLELEGLTAIDDRVFHMGIMQLRDETFMQTREVKFTEGELLTAMYPTKTRFSGKDYKRVRNSLFKLKDVGMYKKEDMFNPENGVILKTKHTFYNYISDLEIEEYKDSNEPSTYTVTVSKTLIDDYLNHQITRIYGEYTNILSDLSWAISFPLQQKRIALTSMRLENPKIPLNISLDFRFFDNAYKFACTKKKAVDRICQALEEMKAAKFLISSGSYKQGRFHLTFLPMSKEELRDINDNIIPRHVLKNLED